jgi:hypothetical protein
MQTGVIERIRIDAIAPARRKAFGNHRPRLIGLMLILYLSTLSVDGVRKVASLQADAIGIIYVITALIYLKAAPRVAWPSREANRTLPIWLFMLSLWCVAVTFFQQIPPELALLGWTSYVFFVPLAYLGVQLTENDRVAAIVLRLVTICGAAIGATVIIGAILKTSAPMLFQPIAVDAAFHSFQGNQIYLPSSVFATAEEASEQLLIAFFAWIALMHLDHGRFRRIFSAALGALIIGGLLFAAARVDLYVVAIGIVAVLVLDHIRVSASTLPSAVRKRSGMRSERMRSGLGITVFLAGVGSTCFMLFWGGSMLQSFLVSGSAGSRISIMFSLTDPASLIGQGPGTSTQGTVVLPGVSAAFTSWPGAPDSYFMDGRVYTSVEGGLAKTWLELGVIGVALYGAVFLSALLPAICFLRRLDGVGTTLIVLVGAMGVIFLKNHQSLDDPLIQPLFWLAVGGIWGRIRAMSLCFVNPALEFDEGALMNVKYLVFPLPGGRRVSLRQWPAYTDSARFWERTYAQGETNGNGYFSKGPSTETCRSDFFVYERA